MAETDELKSKLNDLIASQGAARGIAQIDAGGAVPPDTLLDNTTITSVATAGGATVILVDASANDVIVNFPEAAESTNYTYVIKKIDTSSNAVYLNPYGSDKIEDESVIEITVPDTSITIHCNGTGWVIIMAYIPMQESLAEIKEIQERLIDILKDMKLCLSKMSNIDFKED
jgi:hypothetical protein